METCQIDVSNDSSEGSDVTSKANEGHKLHKDTDEIS